MERREFLLHAEIEGDALEAWIESGWLGPIEADAFPMPTSPVPA